MMQTLSLQNVSKSFGAVNANVDVSFTLQAGSIHGLVGENGAGKSTAMKILFGLHTPDRGQVLRDGQPVQHWNTATAAQSGIGMVQQHFHLSEVETAHDNIVLGRESRRFGLRDRKAERKKIEALMQETGFEVPLDAKVGDLSVGAKSRCEILKSLYCGAKTLILDEPTAVLTPQEVQEFLTVLKKLRTRGYSILIVTHKLSEVMDVCDEATILRAGRTVAHCSVKDTNAKELAELMVGRTLSLPKRPEHAPHMEMILEVRGNAAFGVRSGELIGIAGVEGNGQDELIDFLTGHGNALSKKNLSATLFGKDISRSSALDLRRQNIAIIPPDRHRDGLVLDFSAEENLWLGRKQASRRNTEKLPHDANSTRTQLARFDVRPSDPTLPAGKFSGGNQQKIIFSRELDSLAKPAFILAAHPTRGVDLGAIETIHRELLGQAQDGAGVLVVSSELSELYALCHQIYVMYRGQTIGPFRRHPQTHHFDESAIGQAMAGVQAGGSA